MAKIVLNPVCVDSYLDSPEMVAAYEEACREEGMEPELFKILVESMEQMGEITRGDGVKLV